MLLMDEQLDVSFQLIPKLCRITLLLREGELF